MDQEAEGIRFLWGSMLRDYRDMWIRQGRDMIHIALAMGYGWSDMERNIYETSATALAEQWAAFIELWESFQLSHLRAWSWGGDQSSWQ